MATMVPLVLTAVMAAGEQVPMAVPYTSSTAAPPSEAWYSATVMLLAVMVETVEIKRKGHILAAADTGSGKQTLTTPITMTISGGKCSISNGYTPRAVTANIDLVV